MSTNADPKFPAGFKWGLSTSAYQIEGGHDADGKGLSDWDVFCQNPKNIEDGSNGNIACDSYHKYKEDVKLLKNMKAKVYRFSISWSRILPNGTKSHVNAAGIDYYNRLIDELVQNSIEPMVTLFHWDTPAALKGDWLSEETIEHFADYARICFETFGDRVKEWITINEPYVYAVTGFTVGAFPPGIKDKWISAYICGHNLLKAHALAYHIYDKEFRATQQGRIGISLDSRYYMPYDENSPEDCAAAERALQFQMGWFGHPIFKGDYPAVMKEFVGRRSQEEGREKSRLPEFSAKWIESIKGTADFLGVNHYTSRLVKYKKSSCEMVSESMELEFSYDGDFELGVDPSWKAASGAFWIYPVPQGIRGLINWASKEYNNIEIIVTENGVGTADGRVDDAERVTFYRDYIEEVRKAMAEDGNNVTGYIAWSLIDNFEWCFGYGPKFGVHAVDFDSPGRERTPKASARFLTQIFENADCN